MEDQVVEHGLQILSATQTLSGTLLPASVEVAESIKLLQGTIADLNVEIAGWKGALRMLAIVGAVVAFLISTGLAYLAWRSP